MALDIKKILIRSIGVVLCILFFIFARKLNHESNYENSGQKEIYVWILYTLSLGSLIVIGKKAWFNILIIFICIFMMYWFFAR